MHERAGQAVAKYSKCGDLKEVYDITREDLADTMTQSVAVTDDLSLLSIHGRDLSGN